MNYLELLNQSYAITNNIGNNRISPMAFLGGHVFDFTTYDDDMDELLGSKALEVCEAISNGKTFDYIKNEDNYQWYILMVNMSFFSGMLEWGGSIRGAWWDHGFSFDLDTCSLRDKESQSIEIKMSENEWREFIVAMREFVNSAKPNIMK